MRHERKNQLSQNYKNKPGSSWSSLGSRPQPWTWWREVCFQTWYRKAGTGARIYGAPTMYHNNMSCFRASYWVHQNVHSGFSVTSYGKIRMIFLTNPIFIPHNNSMSRYHCYHICFSYCIAEKTDPLCVLSKVAQVRSGMARTRAA